MPPGSPPPRSRAAEFAALVAFARELTQADEAQAVFAAVRARIDADLKPTLVQGYLAAKGGQSLVPAATRDADATADGEDRDLLAEAILSDHRERRALVRFRPAAEIFGARDDARTIIARVRFTHRRRLLGAMAIGAAHWPAARRTLLRGLAAIASGALFQIDNQRAARQLRESIDQVDDAISLYDENDGIIFSNLAYHRLFPHYPPPHRLIGMTHEQLYRLDLEQGAIDDPLAKSDPEAYLADRMRRARHLRDNSREIQTVRGRTFIYTRTRTQNGATLSRRTDITDLKRAQQAILEREAQLREIAFRDRLTGLFNRAHLYDVLKATLEARNVAHAPPIALILLDLDGFKAVNDRHGHLAGDQLLVEVARRLRSHAPEPDVAARLGGDEFALMIVAPGPPEALAERARRLLEDIWRPIRIDHGATHVQGSVGVAYSGAEASDPDALLGNADIALYDAKRRRPGDLSFYKPAMREELLEGKRLVEELKQGLALGQFLLEYQPQFCLRRRALTGFEALLRWRHPRRGLIPPGAFIEAAETTGVIGPIGEWALREACAAAARWPEAVRIAVNVSGVQLRDGMLPKSVASAIVASGLDPRRLELEITETALLADVPATHRALDQCRSMGVRIALDDFGAGFSSLRYLNSFPFDRIKIDRGFVRAIDGGDAKARIVLENILRLGQALGASITAEGVETPEQLAFLYAADCPEAQGFLFSRPVPAERADLIARRARRALIRSRDAA